MPSSLCPYTYPVIIKENDLIAAVLLSAALVHLSSASRCSLASLPKRRGVQRVISYPEPYDQVDPCDFVPAQKRVELAHMQACTRSWSIIYHTKKRRPPVSTGSKQPWLERLGTPSMVGNTARGFDTPRSLVCPLCVEIRLQADVVGLFIPPPREKSESGLGIVHLSNRRTRIC